MSRIVVGLTTLAIAAALFSQTKSNRSLTAPTYYIAASAEYRDGEQIWLRGTPTELCTTLAQEFSVL
jgi:hypothetical protein